MVEVRKGGGKREAGSRERGPRDEGAGSSSHGWHGVAFYPLHDNYGMVWGMGSFRFVFCAIQIDAHSTVHQS